MKIYTSHKKTFIIVLIVLLLIVISYFSYAFATKALWPFQETTPVPSYQANDDTPGTVRTTEDDAESQDAKDRIIEEEDNPSEPTTTSSVIISSAMIVGDQLEVRAFTADIIEPGTCTLDATKGTETESFTSPAFIDARSTICEPFRIDSSQLSSGTWKLVVSLKTASTNGASEAVEVVIP